jgi:hypothetical protein
MSILRFLLPKGKPLVMLRDAALYITGLLKEEHDAPEWQAAMQALLPVAEHNGPTIACTYSAGSVTNVPAAI